MPISVRYYVLPVDGPLRLIPARIADALVFQRDTIPEFADSRQRVAQVVLDNERGKPVRILDVRGQHWEFDERGRLRLDHEWARFTIDSRPEPEGKIVDLRPQIDRARWKARTRWEITGEDLDRLIAAIWPGRELSGTAVATVKSSAPKRPPLTHDGREALREIGAAKSSIEGTIEHLNEPALKGLAYEALDHASAYETERILWTAIAGAADRQRAILVQRRTGRGVFYACVRIWRWTNTARSESQEVATFEERCEGLKAAEAAARRLLIENAEYVGADVRVEAEILTEMEWTPLASRDEA